MCEVKFFFSKGSSRVDSQARLCRVESRFGSIERCAVTESLGALDSHCGRFRWSRAVRAMSVVAVRTSLATLDPTVEPRITGGRGSFAAALDGALSKEPVWLLETFGIFPNGSPVSRRLFARSNPGRKRVGPVAVSLSSRVRGAEVSIFVNGAKLVCATELRVLLDALERDV